MKRHAAAALAPLLLLAACGPSPQQHTVRLLNDRLQQQLAPDIAAGTAVLQPTPDGAQVTLLGSSLFPADPRNLGQQPTDVRADVVEALLDPKLMRVQVTDNAPLPPYQQDTRVRNVMRYFADNGMSPVLGYDQAPPPGSVPPGLAITISVHCPRGDGIIGYGDGTSKPVCE